jgi:hypothetical protein
MKRSGILQRGPWLPSEQTIARDREWRRSQQAALQRARQKPRQPRDTGPDRETRDRLAERSVGRCEMCGSTWCLVPHHRQPRGKGGSPLPQINVLSNLLHLCPKCHDCVESRRAWAKGLGLLVPRPTVPADVPVSLRIGRVLLADDGQRTPATEMAA